MEFVITHSQSDNNHRLGTEQGTEIRTFLIKKTFQLWFNRQVQCGLTSSGDALVDDEEDEDDHHGHKHHTGYHPHP